MKALAWLIRLVRRRMAEMDRAEQAANSRPDTIIRQICAIGSVPWLADTFIRHGAEPRTVAHTLCAAMGNDPEGGRVELQSLEFLAPAESAAVWGAKDREWLNQMGRAFAEEETEIRR